MSIFRRGKSEPEHIWPESFFHNHLVTMREPRTASVTYDYDDGFYKVVYWDGRSSEVSYFDEVETNVLRKMTAGNQFGQYDLLYDKGHGKTWQVVCCLSESGEKILTALGNGFVWNTRRRQPDIRKTIEWWGDKIFGHWTVKHQYWKKVKRIPNRRVRNTILDTAHYRMERSVNLKDMHWDAGDYYDAIFRSGKLKGEHFTLVETISDDVTRNRIKQKLMYYKLIGAHEFDEIIIDNQAD